MYFFYIHSLFLGWKRSFREWKYDLFKDIPNTDTAQGVEQITYERMNKMVEAGELDPLTNAQRPVDMGNKKKIFRRDLGENWLKDTFGDNYEDVIDKRIKDHYQPLKMCK